MIDKEALYKAREDTKNEILEKLKVCDRFGVVRPQGFGKTYIITELCKELPGKKLIIEPTEGINEYIEQFGLNKSTDCIIYHSLLHKDFNPKELLQYDYIFLDEMHRALAPNWGKVLKETLASFKGKIIGFSATPIRGDGLNSVQKLFNGEQISELSLVEAILEGLLPQPTYVTGIYEVQEKDIYNIIKNETLAKQFYDYDLNNNLEFIFKKYLDLTPNKCLHIIVFCHRISDIKKAKKNMERWIDIRPVKHYEVHSDKHKEENQKAIKDFESATTGLNIIYSANMLNEGIHPKKLDAVVFLRKTKSSVVYKQQLGRVISEYLDNSIVFDLVNNIYNIETGYMKEFKNYAKIHNIKYENIKTKFNEPLKIYEEQKDLIKLLTFKEEKNIIRFTKEEEEFILNNYKTMSLYKLNKELGRNPRYSSGNSAIKAFLKSKGISFDFSINSSKSKLSKEDKDFILNNYKTLKIKEIKEKFDINGTTIYNLLKKHGINSARVRRLTQKDKDFIFNNHQNMTVIDIAKELNVDRNTVYCFLKRNNIVKAKPKHIYNKELTKEGEDFVLKNYNNLSKSTLARKFNVSMKTMSKFYKQNNIKSMFKSKLSLREKTYILENYKHKTRSQISKDLNRNMNTISSFMNDAGITSPLNIRISVDEYLYIEEYVLKNYKQKSKNQMSKELHRSIHVINRVFTKYNLVPIYTNQYGSKQC